MAPRSNIILRKYYIYDPNVRVGEELGGLRVISDKDDKGEPKQGTSHVLAAPQMIQYWIDQGLLGEKPVGEISSAHKKLLAQITRGRSEDVDATPTRVPKYDKRMQSGAPADALRSPTSSRLAARAKAARQKKDKTNKPAKKPEPRPTATPSPRT